MNHLLFRVFLFFFLAGCTTEDDTNNRIQVLAPVTAVDFPNNFIRGKSHEIKVVFRRPTNCHRFLGFDKAENGNEIVIGVVTSFNPLIENCRDTGELSADAKLNFVAEREDFYIFKFWQGKNSDNEDIFLIKRISVERPEN